VDYTGLGSIGTATASPLWGDTVNATPLSDIRTWMNTYRTNNDNEMPLVGLTSQAVLDALALTDDVKNALTPAGVVSPSIAVTPGNVQALLGSFGLPPLASTTPWSRWRCQHQRAGRQEDRLPARALT
jgi:hypothetical protein